MSWGLVGGAAVSVIGGALLSKGGSKGGGGSSSVSGYDPYAPYRGDAAKKLNDLMADPSTLENLPEYKAQTQAAERTIASQGYTGSGNALVAAANAGGNAYQQAFNNLSMLAGAGQNPAYAQGAANQQANYQQQASNQMWGQIGGIAGNVINKYTNGSNSNMPPIDTSLPMDNISIDYGSPTVNNLPITF